VLVVFLANSRKKKRNIPNRNGVKSQVYTTSIMAKESPPYKKSIVYRLKRGGLERIAPTTGETGPLGEM